MRLLATLEVKIKKGNLPPFISLLYEQKCDVKNVELVEESSREDRFRLDLIYFNRNTLKTLVKKISDNGDRFTVVALRNHLEKNIRGGILNLAGKMPLEDENDFQTGILGAHELIGEKIASDQNAVSYTGISKNVALVSGISEKSDSKMQKFLRAHARAEIESVIINRFRGLNAYPIGMTYNVAEDLIRTMQRIENNFSLIRIMHIDEAEISWYEQMYADFTLPVISYEMDDMPLYMLTLIQKIMKLNKLNSRETTIGFIGIDISVLRITSLLMKLGFMRVLGFDQFEKSLLAIENEGGMATTPKNIFSNSDIIILLKNNFDESVYKNIRPGQFFISLFTDDRIDIKELLEKGVRKYINVEGLNQTIIVPGLIQGILSSGIKYLDDLKLIDISNKLVDSVSSSYGYPDHFSDIHTRISDLVIGTAEKKE
jgi:hypothetical protein